MIVLALLSSSVCHQLTWQLLLLENVMSVMDLSTGRSMSFILTGLQMSVSTKLIWVTFPEKVSHLPSSWWVLRHVYFIIETSPEVFVSKNQ